MPDKMGKDQKNVIVAVYVERPRKRRLLTSNGGVSTHHHHHHHHHFHLHRSHKHGGVGGSSNRRSELLDYSRRLRASAAKTPHNHHQNKPISVSSSVQQQPINQIMAAQAKRKHAKAPACMGNWKSFLKSLTMSSGGKKKKKKNNNNSSSTNFTATKAKVIMQSFQVHKNKGFFKKILTAIQKYR